MQVGVDDTGDLSPGEREFRDRLCARLSAANMLAVSLHELAESSDDATVDGELVSEIAISISRRLDACLVGLGDIPLGIAMKIDKWMDPRHVGEAGRAA